MTNGGWYRNGRRQRCTRCNARRPARDGLCRTCWRERAASAQVSDLQPNVSRGTFGAESSMLGMPIVLDPHVPADCVLVVSGRETLVLRTKPQTLWRRAAWRARHPFTRCPLVSDTLSALRRASAA